MTSPQGSGTPPRPPVAGDATGIGSGWAPRPSAGPDTAGAASAVPSAALPTPAGA
ncbi:MAG: hypothetical protein JWN08_3816, partial [Frankiales bacterium]|nr:hypothetical protein [Frankiales bacterium]